ncbi:MAG: hypothetical protein DRP82_03230 [Planctomycetota bacterium]|nr:MAG: hypothetical protein DRP82_03230 [Planctomycetota bacterium]
MTTVAFVGKGGVGKTSLAADLVRYLVEQKAGSVLAVDADPNHNLDLALGVEVKKTIADLRDDVMRQALKIPPGMSKERLIEYGVFEALAEADGFALLTMGRPEGPGCYCYVNHVLRRVLEVLVKDYDYVVMDCEAGMEHLNRRTTQDVDLMLVVCQPTRASVVAAERIASIAEKLPIGVKRMCAVLNMLHSEAPEAVVEKIKAIPLEIVAEIPYIGSEVEPGSLWRGISELAKLWDSIRRKLSDMPGTVNR